MKATNFLSDALLHELFEYREGGRLFWKKRVSQCSPAGAEAGRPTKSGYRQVNYQYRSYMVHRIIYALHRGRWPEQVDHINGDKTDCRIENLREANNSLNQANRPMTKANTTGYKGVTFRKEREMYVAQIKKDNKLHYLGLFKCPEEASMAYKEMAVKLFGEFAYE